MAKRKNTTARKPEGTFPNQVIIKPKTENQAFYMREIESHDITFGLGPAGTGKTFLAASMAVKYLIEGKVDRIILVRPAVEAGEKLGFLPGDFKEKIDPYMRPIFDALNHYLTFSQIEDLVSKNQIEIAPLAYMRGRSLYRAFIVLDEAQNTTIKQMKMFLTRIGLHSKAVVTGDELQSDIPGEVNGLVDAVERLEDVEEIGVCEFKRSDIVRHPLIQKIVEAYEEEN